jgi:cytochrome b subunit of formate dehydrogenase
VLRPFVLLFSQIIDSCSNGLRLLAVLAITILFFWAVQITFLVWAFVQIPKNVIAYMETTDIGKAIGCLLWESHNAVESSLDKWMSSINSGVSRDEYVSVV